ncbi:hypothetical protein KFL_000730130 [Klebsormidium nitens]|uniref:Uncharacterized protein n=1 Tax=Klebsormidium nitens TaxID=105231 RepID=A0A1Y1HXD7_KLENI|nr:hypothetical protein KFL_000730130 [Klebsormidium nitens]|eukprot:GAQ81176.1 hypothetical protein KFL_000730130 [Klebsormidium nitens]
MGAVLEGSPANLAKTILLLIGCLCAVAGLSQLRPEGRDLTGSFLLRVTGSASFLGCRNQTVFVTFSNESASAAPVGGDAESVATRAQLREGVAPLSIVEGELEECEVPCDILQLGNLTSLSEVEKVNCNIQYFNMTQMLTLLAAHKGQAWVQYSGDSLIRNQFMTIAEEILGLEANTIPHTHGICCTLDGLARNSSDRCTTWIGTDINPQDPSTYTWERARRALRDKTADFCFTLLDNIIVTDAIGAVPLLFKPGEIHPLVVVYDMGLHSMFHGFSQLGYRHHLETLTEKLRAVRQQQLEAGKARKWANETGVQTVSSEGMMFTRFIYHMPTAYTEDIFKFVDPLRRNERTELFVKILEQHVAKNEDLYSVVDTNRDDLEYVEGKEMYAGEAKMRKVHGWGA